MHTRAEILVKGRVQGVGYRYFAFHKARNLDLCGHVCNLSDGSVEVVVEGEKNVILTFISNLRVGPTQSQVNDVIVNFRECKNEYNTFNIL